MLVVDLMGRMKMGMVSVDLGVWMMKRSTDCVCYRDTDMRKALPKDSKRETVRDSSRGINVVVDVQ